MAHGIMPGFGLPEKEICYWPGANEDRVDSSFRSVLTILLDFVSRFSSFPGHAPAAPIWSFE